jgi:predicted TIM-barrel fold metal-dependent hydrolase
MPEAPLIDSHAHVWKRDMPFIDNPRHTPDYDFTAEDYLAQLDQHGVQMAVLAGASLFGDYNEYMIDCLRKYKRLRGTVILNPSVERIVLDDMDKHGVVGVRLMFRGLATIPDITTYEYRRMFRRIRDLGWHVHLHTEGQRLAALIEFLETTGVKLVIDHFGTPDPQKGIECDGFQRMMKSIEKGNTWVKMSAGYRIGDAAAATYAKELIRKVGPDRLLWASDSPFASFESTMTYQHAIDALDDWTSDPLIRRKITADNPIGLYFSE